MYPSRHPYRHPNLASTRPDTQPPPPPPPYTMAQPRPRSRSPQNYNAYGHLRTFNPNTNMHQPFRSKSPRLDPSSRKNAQNVPIMPTNYAGPPPQFRTAGRVPGYVSRPQRPASRSRTRSPRPHPSSIKNAQNVPVMPANYAGPPAQFRIGANQPMPKPGSIKNRHNVPTMPENYNGPVAQFQVSGREPIDRYGNPIMGGGDGRVKNAENVPMMPENYNGPIAQFRV